MTRVRWLWRAVVLRRVVVDEVLRRRRDKTVARRLPARPLKRQGRGPRRIVADRGRRAGVRGRGGARGRAHPRSPGPNGLDNRAESSRVPLRERERQTQGSRPPEGLPRPVPVFSTARDLFAPPVAGPPSPPAAPGAGLPMGG